MKTILLILKISHDIAYVSELELPVRGSSVRVILKKGHGARNLSVIYTSIGTNITNAKVIWFSLHAKLRHKRLCTAVIDS